VKKRKEKKGIKLMRIKRWPIGHKENEVKSHHSLYKKFIQKNGAKQFSTAK
jgi:hypothetical protein